MALTERNKKLTQLNERVSETQYDVLYPETIAAQVIESTDKKFVSQTQIDFWNRVAGSGLVYRGDWTAGTEYKQYDLVRFKDSSHEYRFYICLKDNTGAVGNAPSINASTTNWLNINMDSYNADQADKVATIKLTAPTSGTSNYYITGVNSNNNTAQFEDLFTNGTIYLSVDTAGKVTLMTGDITATGTVTATKFKGPLEGKADTAGRADEAIDYVRYYRDSEGHYTTATGQSSATPVEKDTKQIDTAIDSLERAVAAIEGGETANVLAKKLYLQKDGTQVAKFDNAEDVTFNVKQTYSPEDLNAGIAATDARGNFIVDNKVSVKWLPDSILGQLSYKGTYSAAVSVTRTAKTGDYYIVTTAGNYWPSGTLVTGYEETTTPYYFNVGDWAIFNGTDGWAKVDNTDAVTMVNSQIGAVEIYKGNWVPNTQYYKGDIVKNSTNGCLYICNTTHQDGTDMDGTKWDLFGRTYSATDAIKLDGTIFKHDVTITQATQEEIDAASKTLEPTGTGKSFTVPSFTTDSFGHVNKLFNKTITIGDGFVNTWRAVYLDGVTDPILGTGTDTNPLKFKGDTWVNLSYSENMLNINHKQITDAVHTDMSASKVTTALDTDDILYAGQGYSIPSFTVDGAGHIVASEMKRFRLADTGFTHSHFNITTTNNVKNIEAYAAATAVTSWVNNADNKLKFYLGTVTPTNTERMNFNGAFHATQLWQGANQVLDAGIQLDNGVATKGTYADGVLTAPDSGITAGTYSVVTVNSKGIATAGGQIVEFGNVVDADPSNALAVGGLFFRLMGVVTA